MDRLEKLKLNSIENPGKTKKGCTNCKKKKEVSEPLPPLEILFIPSVDDIKLAYAELTSFGGVKDNMRKFINDVYISIFNEEFDFVCGSCASKQARKFHNHITKELNIKL